MLLSHCGEYMANGLTNAVRHEFVMIANDRQTFVSVRKHSRSFLWCFECYAGLTSGECMENGLTNAIRHQFAIIAKIILRSLRLVANCIRKPIRLIFATFWRICREYIFLHSQGYSPQCESSIMKTLRLPHMVCHWTTNIKQ